MTDPKTVDNARAGLAEWSAGSRDNFHAVTEVVGAPSGGADRDPISILSYLQRYINELPLDEFEESDWVTLHTDIVSFLAMAMAVERRASWQVRDAPDSTRGYRYVLSAFDAQGNTHDVDPFEVVAQELQHRPIEVARILANAEVSLGAPRIE